MSRKKISSTVYFEAAQHDAVRALVERTKVPMAVWMRIGIDYVLANAEPDPQAFLAAAGRGGAKP